MKTTEEKLTALRTLMQQHGLSAYLLPMADRFHNEYLPPHERDLQWLTGFTGSAGFAIILQDSAAFFTDGRYTLQAEDELDTTLFSLQDITRLPPSDWLRNCIKPGGNIGFDGWQLTTKQAESYQQSLAEAGATLTPTPNLIHQIWQEDRPKETVKEAFIHNIKYSGEATDNKIKSLLDVLQRNTVDACFLSLPESIGWLLNIRGHDLPHTPFLMAYALIETSGKIILFTHPEKLAHLSPQSIAPALTIISFDEMEEALSQHVTGKQIQLDERYTPATLAALLGTHATHIHHAEDPCLLPKACKNETQLACIREAHIRDGIALTTGLHWIQNAMQRGREITEIDIAEKLHELRTQQEDFFSLSFPAIVGSGPNGAIVHYHATKTSNRSLKPNELLLIDSGAQYLGGTTDVTRTLAIGTPTEDMCHHYTRVLQGHIALATVQFPEGTGGAQLDVLARSPLWAKGLDYAHGTGHGVGQFMNVHEGPQSISKRGSAVPLKPGMVCSNEPGYYEPGAYGIRIENLVAVRESGHPGFLEFETLTCAPLDPVLIAPTLLSPTEKDWVNRYHTWVRETLSPLVSPEVAAWLAEITAPI